MSKFNEKWLCVTVYGFYIDISHNLTLLRGEITRLLKLLFKSCQNWKTCCQKSDEKSLKMVKYVDLDKKYYLMSGKLEYCIIIFYTNGKRYLFPSCLFFFFNTFYIYVLHLHFNMNGTSSNLHWSRSWK